MQKKAPAEKEFNPALFKRLCKIQCTEKEICSVLGYKSHKTLIAKCVQHFGKNFEECFAEFSVSGLASLRRLQWKTAKAGSVPMLIWLGKQWLKQTDKQELTTDCIINVKLPAELMDDENVVSV